MLRYDFVFSYWIFFWWILYILHLTGDYNPKFLLLLGLLENLIVIFAMFYYRTKVYLLLLFIIVNIFIKIIPLYFVWNHRITMKDMFASGFIFCIYLFWLYINSIPISIHFFSKEMNDFVKKNKNIFPTTRLLMKLYNDFLH